MLDQRHRSGDPRADRRAEYAEHYARTGDVKAAIELIGQALELVPGWTLGRFRLGEYLETSGEREKAARTYALLLAEDLEDRYGAGLKLATLGASPVPGAPPPAFVANLFDQYAERFEMSLVEKLRYRVPDSLFGLIAAEGGSGALGRTLDLGCGTGLMGERLRRGADLLHGVDLSGGMLAKARQKRIYDALFKADMLALPDAVIGQSYDLVAAADVLNYLGDLVPALTMIRQLLTPGGRFAFSVETEAQGGAFHLRRNLRYAHAPAHLECILTQAGFKVKRQEATILRQEGGVDVAGALLLCART